MAIVNPSRPTAVTPPTTGHAVPIAMKTAVVETRFTPVQDLLTHISGSRYVVDYFSQLLGAEDHPRPQDISLQPAQQAYDRISQLEMRLQGELSQSPDDTSKEFEVTGEAILYPGIVPNDGDMFVGDVGQGQWGIFAITRATPLSIYKQTCYRLNFRLIAREDQVRLSDLHRKVVANRHFVMDFLRAGKNPVVIDEEFSKYRSLDQLFSTMIADYFRSFYSDVCQTLVIPGQKGGAYDPFLVKAILSILEVTQHPLLKKIQRHAIDTSYAYNTTTIWDALLNVEPSYLYLATQRVGLVSKSYIKDRSAFGGLYWTQIGQLMYPVDDRIDADTKFTRLVYADPMLPQDGGAPLTDLERLILNTDDTVNMPLTGDGDPPPPPRQIPNVNEDLYYVFTKAFYFKDTDQMSQLETIVWSFLEHNEIDVGKLYTLVDSSRRWDRLERFYYAPVLMLLCVVALRGPSHA